MKQQDVTIQSIQRHQEDLNWNINNAWMNFQVSKQEELYKYIYLGRDMRIRRPS